MAVYEGRPEFEVGGRLGKDRSGGRDGRVMYVRTLSCKTFLPALSSRLRVKFLAFS